MRAVSENGKGLIYWRLGREAIVPLNVTEYTDGYTAVSDVATRNAVFSWHVARSDDDDEMVRDGIRWRAVEYWRKGISVNWFL